MLPNAALTTSCRRMVLTAVLTVLTRFSRSQRIDLGRMGARLAVTKIASGPVGSAGRPRSTWSSRSGLTWFLTEGLARHARQPGHSDIKRLPRWPAPVSRTRWRNLVVPWSNIIRINEAALTVDLVPL